MAAVTLLLALAPMQIYHAQKGKGYTVETAALLVAALCWLRLHAWARGGETREAPRLTVAAWPRWAGYALATLVAMGTNYLAVLALAATAWAARQGMGRRALAGHWLRWLAGTRLLVRLPPRWRVGRGLAAAWLLLPLALGYLFHLRFPWFFPRYLLFIQPALLAAPVLRGHYSSGPDSPEDLFWPALFEAMRPYVREGDGMIARTSWIPGYLKTYLGPAPQPAWILGYSDEEAVDEAVSRFLSHHGRVWQIDYQLDPLAEENDSAVALRGEAALAYRNRIGVATAALFVGTDSLLVAANGEAQVSAFANGVRLRWAPQQVAAAPGNVVGLSVIWWTERPLDEWLVRFVHIIDGEGTLVAQIDREPVMGAARSY